MSRRRAASSFRLRTKTVDTGDSTPEIFEESENESVRSPDLDSKDTQERTLTFGNGPSSDDDSDKGQLVVVHKTKRQGEVSPRNTESPVARDSVTPDPTSDSSSTEDSEDYTSETDQTIIESFKASSPKIKRRVFKSLKDVVHLVEEENREESLKRKSVFGFISSTGLSERLSRASSVGTKMIPKIVFPAAPKLFRDAWVLTELLLTIVQFVYAFLSTDYRINKVYNGIYITLSCVNLALALIDSFYYFYELGSCMVLYRKCKKRMRSRKKQDTEYKLIESSLDSSDNSDSEIDDEEMNSITDMQSSCMKRCRLSPKRKEQLNMWFELIRNVLSELLIYPLVVLDLFGLISDPQIEDKLNFSFFLVGSFYLVLSVYIARVMITLLTLLTLKNLLSSSDSGRQNIFFIVRFLFHSVSQVLVHLCCVVAVGIKIKQENDHNEGRYHASPILWIVVVGGWFIPFLGVLSYFLVNYFWAQQFSIGFFMELMSLLQEGDVVGSLMQSKETMKAEADERASKILEKMEYTEIKKEYKEWSSSGRVSKLIYPVKLPLFILLCIAYNLALGGFFATLFLTYKNGHIVPIHFNDATGISLLVIVVIIALANIHLIVVSNATIAVFLSALVCVFFLPGFFAVPIFILLFAIYRQLHKFNKI